MLRFRSLHVRLLAAFGLTLGLFGLVVLEGWIGERAVAARYEYAVEADQLADIGDRLLAAMVDQANGLRGYLVAGDAQLLHTYRDGVAEYDQLLREVRQRQPLDPETVSLLQAQLDAAVAWQTAAAPLATGQPSQAIADRFEIQNRQLFDEFRAANVTFRDHLAARRDGAIEDARKLANLVDLVAIVAGVLAVGVAALALLRTAQSIERPISRLLGGTVRVSAGDLQVRLDPPPERELARLVEGFNAMVAALGEARARADRSAEELREALQNERDLTRRLQELDGVRAEFVGFIAHDLRAPLAAVRRYAELLREHAEQLPASDRARFLGVIETQARQAGTLADDVLTVARLDSGEMAFARASFDLSRLVQEIALERAAGAEQHRFEIDAEPALVEGDPQRLRQALVNLVENAEKYSPSGGRIRIRVELLGDDVRVSIQDEGIGISPAQLKGLFHKFARVEDRSTEDIPGTGLGLYICRRIIEAHSGRVWASSAPGQGSTFTISLPLASGSGSAPEPASPTTSATPA
ncbi:MAG: CHASE3 domain-containing protein [Chloroflexi bacterium]|nr:CHASE3 domain-containing protein [Chloroflexota bacterium]